MADLGELVEAGLAKLRQGRATQPAPEPPKSRFDEMFPPERIAAIKKKELRRFIQAQDKKGENWPKAVAEDKASK